MAHARTEAGRGNCHPNPYAQGLVDALLTSAVLALAVTWYFTRRTQHSIAQVTTSATEIAHGNYCLRIPATFLGREFDMLAETFNELAHRLDSVETIRRRILVDLAHEMRTPLATLDAHLEALEDGLRELDQPTLAVLHASSHRLGRLAEDITAVSLAQEGAIEIRTVTTAPRQLQLPPYERPGTGTPRSESRSARTSRPTSR